MYLVISVLPSPTSSSQGAGRHVLGHLGVAELDDVGRRAAGQRRVELGQVVGPRLVLDVDGDVRVLRLDRGVGGVDQLGPALLRVDLQPDGERARGVGRGARRAATRVAGRAGGQGERTRHGARDEELAELHSPSGIPAIRSRWPDVPPGPGGRLV
jgi:hypothetical protein